MAVFTPITLAQLTPWLQQFNLGQAVDLCEIPQGVENSNFFLTLRKNQQSTTYVLTLFERLSFTQLPFYLHLTQHLAARGIPVPAPINNQQGEILSLLNGKPAVLVNKLPGQSLTTPTPHHCQQVGAVLARMHLAGQDYPNQQKNLRSLSWWQETIPLVLPYLAPVQHDLLTQELGFQEQFFASDTYADLPMGPGHCDLFRDNILFDTIDGQDHLCGVFDFYFAGYDTWLFDLAVTVNDWCVDLQSGLLDSARAYALLHAYHAIRPFQASEKYCWPAMLRAAALRFWVSRLWDFYLPRSAKIVQLHDPTHFERILHHHTQTLHSPWIT